MLEEDAEGLWPKLQHKLNELDQTRLDRLHDWTQLRPRTWQDQQPVDQPLPIGPAIAALASLYQALPKEDAQTRRQIEALAKEILGNYSGVFPPPDPPGKPSGSRGQSRGTPHGKTVVFTAPDYGRADGDGGNNVCDACGQDLPEGD